MLASFGLRIEFSTCVARGYFKERFPSSVQVLNSLSNRHGSKRMEGFKTVLKKIEIKRNKSSICNHVIQPTCLVLVVVALFVWSTQSDTSFYFRVSKFRTFFYRVGIPLLRNQRTRNPPQSPPLSLLHHSSTLHRAFPTELPSSS